MKLHQMLAGVAILLLSEFLQAFTCAANAPSDPDPKYKPTIYAQLPDDMYGPDAMCYDANRDILYLAVPNFLLEEGLDLPETSSFLLKVNRDGTTEKLYEFPIFPGEVKIGAMGIDLGPDGNLYICDNQYFFDPDFKSRIWRLPMKDGVPAGDIQLVAEGLKVSNAILWNGDRVFVTDTILDEPGKYGSGGVWMFSAQEFLKAGSEEGCPPISVERFKDGKRGPRLIIVEDVENIRGNVCGADGICRDKRGVFYFGNYGDGAFYRFRLAEDGKVECEKIHRAGDQFRCVDGICYDEETDSVYITDSANNAVWSCKCKPWGEKIDFVRIWENEDTDGSDGGLDLPCECRVIKGRKLIISNQDEGSLADGAKSSKTDWPYTLSVIQL